MQSTWVSPYQCEEVGGRLSLLWPAWYIVYFLPLSLDTLQSVLKQGTVVYLMIIFYNACVTCNTGTSFPVPLRPLFQISQELFVSASTLEAL